MSLPVGDLTEVVSSLRVASEADNSRAEHVSGMIADVRARGDDALVDDARRFGAPGFSRDDVRVSSQAMGEAVARMHGDLRDAILMATAQIRATAEALAPRDTEVALSAGQRITSRAVPVNAAGCYVPGGRAAYPSSLLMTAVPAQVAGVGRIAVISPPDDDGRPSDLIVGAAALLGIDEVYAAGGASAIAALAYGTATIAPVDVITGPGNAWVTEAKRQVFGTVGIDGLAGPSEVLIVADVTADPRAIALDLLAQAEHGPDSPAILASDSSAFIDAVEVVLAEEPPNIGPVTLVECPSRARALELADAFAPEHLELCFNGAAEAARRVRCAGAVFVGPNCATAFGDYVAGSNHVLPTGGSARFASALGPATYTRRMSVVDMTDDAVETLVPHLSVLAEAEGFEMHRRSAEIRSAGMREKA